MHNEMTPENLVLAWDRYVKDCEENGRKLIENVARDKTASSIDRIIAIKALIKDARDARNREQILRQAIESMILGGSDKETIILAMQQALARAKA